MRPKSAILLILALGCGLIAAIGVTQVINRDTQANVQQADTRPIIVALRDINPGEIITPEMVKLEPWPKEKIPTDAVDQIEKVQGCRARDDIYMGSPIHERQLLGQGFERQTASDNIPKGYRVVGVKVDMVSGAGLIQPGDRVDVLVNISKNPMKGVHETRTQTILQDIKVFAVEDKFKVDLDDDGKKSNPAKVIQLLVTPAQAETLVLAQQLGKVQLTMRPPGGEDTIKTPGKTPGELFGGTSVGDRKKENPFGDSPKADGFKKFWNGMLNPTSNQKTPEVKETGTSWSMRILAGTEMMNVSMEETTDSSGEKIWQVESGQNAPPATGATTAPQPPLTPPQTTATPPQPGGDGAPNPEATNDGNLLPPTLTPPDTSKSDTAVPPSESSE